MPDAIILPITLTIAGAAALIHVWLGIRVSQLRRRHKVSIGDGDNPLLLARVRAHGNFSETAPIFLVLLGLVELAAGSALLLWAVAILFILGRLAHPFGMEGPGANPLRLFGMATTWLLLAGLALYAIAIPYMESRTPPPAHYAAQPRAST